MITAPMHSWHPMVIHLPLMAFPLAVCFDLADAWTGVPQFRRASHILWGLALLGAGVAVGTGLWAYSRVDHSEAAHVIMTLHRNVALATLGALLIAAIWRWRRPASRPAALYGAAAFLGLLWVAYLGGELVYQNAVGVSSARLTAILHERDSDMGEAHEHGAMKAARADSVRERVPPQTHDH